MIDRSGHSQQQNMPIHCAAPGQQYLRVYLSVRLHSHVCREHAPSTIFMDEVDSVSSARIDGGGSGGNDIRIENMSTSCILLPDNSKHMCTTVTICVHQ